MKLGRRFVGIELDETYFRLAVARISEAYRQSDLFIPAPAKKPTQEALL